MIHDDPEYLRDPREAFVPRRGDYQRSMAILAEAAKGPVDGPSVHGERPGGSGAGTAEPEGAGAISGRHPERQRVVREHATFDGDEGVIAAMQWADLLRIDKALTSAIDCDGDCEEVDCIDRHPHIAWEQPGATPGIVGNVERIAEVAYFACMPGGDTPAELLLGLEKAEAELDELRRQVQAVRDIVDQAIADEKWAYAWDREHVLVPIADLRKAIGGE